MKNKRLEEKEKLIGKLAIVMVSAEVYDESKQYFEVGDLVEIDTVQFDGTFTATLVADPGVRIYSQYGVKKEELWIED